MIRPRYHVAGMRLHAVGPKARLGRRERGTYGTLGYVHYALLRHIGVCPPGRIFDLLRGSYGTLECVHRGGSSTYYGAITAHRSVSTGADLRPTTVAGMSLHAVGPKARLGQRERGAFVLAPSSFVLSVLRSSNYSW